MNIQTKPFFIRKNQKYFISEIILFLAQSYFFLSRSSRLSSSILLIILLVISLKIHKARLYTPVIILSVVLYTLRCALQIDSWLYFILQLLVFFLSIVLSLTIRVFEIPHRYGLYELKYKDPTHTVGFLSKHLNTIPTSIWYPSQQQTNKSLPWLISDKDYRTLYQIFYVDSAQKRHIPFWLFKFCLSYLSTYSLDSHLNARIHNKQKYKIVVFSHGLGANSRGYSCYTHWWARRGFIVVSVQHDGDEPCVHYTVEKEQKEQQKWLYKKRNEQISKRGSEIVKIFECLEKGGLDDVFGQKVEFDSIMLAGHSFGGGSILEAGSSLLTSPLYPLVSRYLCLDPWTFPLSPTSYTNLHRPILFVNSTSFARDNPQFYQIHHKNCHLLSLNPLMSKIHIKGMQHLHPSDMLYTFGTIFVLTGSIKKFGKRMLYVDVLVYIMRLWEEGMKGEEIVEMVEEEVRKKVQGEERMVELDQRKEWND